MNFNEEVEKELKSIGLGGNLVAIAEEDKGAPMDYLELEKKLLLMDWETTRMIRESIRNARIGLPCSSFSANKSVEPGDTFTDDFSQSEKVQELQKRRIPRK